MTMLRHHRAMHSVHEPLLSNGWGAGMVPSSGDTVVNQAEPVSLLMELEASWGRQVADN